MKINKSIFIIVGIIILTVLLIFCVIFLKEKYNNKPEIAHREMIQSKLNIKLPADSLVEHYTYRKKSGVFYAKIFVESDEVIDVKKQIENSFGEALSDVSIIPSPSVIWWDLDKENIEAMYHKYRSGESVSEYRTYNVYLFITKEINGGGFLYVIY